MITFVADPEWPKKLCCFVTKEQKTLGLPVDFEREHPRLPKSVLFGFWAR